MALDLVERWPDWPYSMVVLHGPAGSGKTHLAHVFAARAGATFLAPEQIGALPADQLLVGNHQWVVDGIEQIDDAAGFAQLINHARARGDYILCTARVAPAQLNIALPDLRSRLLAMPAVALGAPDDGLLMGVMAKAFADRQVRIAPDVLAYAAKQLERSYPAVQDFVVAMDALSLSQGRAVTLPLVRQWLNKA